jgi:transposase-like protein
MMFIIEIGGQEIEEPSSSKYLAPLEHRATKRDRRWAMAEEQQREEVQRWTAKRRAALVISLLKGETTAAEAARRHGLKIAEVEDWRDRFLFGAENALRARPQEDEALREEELNRFRRKVGELTMDLDILRTAARLRPTAPGTSHE